MNQTVRTLLTAFGLLTTYFVKAYVSAMIPMPTPVSQTIGMPAGHSMQPGAPVAIQSVSTGMPAPSMPEMINTPGTLIQESIPQQKVEATLAEPAKKDADNTSRNEEKNIYLNFENTDLAHFVNYMAELKKINLIPDKSLESAKVSLTIRDPLNLEGAWNIFLTVLEMANFSIIKVGDVYKVVAKDQKLKQPLPAYINVPSETLPDSDLLIRYVTFLENINVESIQELIKSMLSATHGLIVQPDVNGLIITDKSYNIKAASKIIQELDQAGQPEAVVVLRLKQANAPEVRDLLASLISKQDGGPLARLLGRVEGTKEYFPPGTKIIAEERTNSLILLGAPGPIAKIEKFVTENIDTELKGIDSPLHIYELQHTNAEQIATVLKTVVEAPQGGAGQQASKYGAVRGGVKYFKSMIIEVDKEGNRLIISSTDKQDWKMLKKTIKDLDKPQPQVALETLIVSINSIDMKNLGGMMRDKKTGILGRNIDFQTTPIGSTPSILTNPPNTSGGTNVSLLGNLLNQLALTQGATLLSIGKSTNIWAVFNAVKSITNASVLSQPFVTVGNKAQANVVVGQTLRILNEQGATESGFGEVKAETTLQVQPQINLDGIVRLAIDTKIENFDDVKAGNGNKSTKHVKTDVTIADGQVLILGGFVSTQVSDIAQKTPLFSDLPILGWFFKNQQRTVTKNYVFVFMSPTIIKPREKPGMQLYTKMKLHDATDQIEKTVITTKTKDPIFNWFFNPKSENYSHKVIDYANARYQPTSVDIQNDPYYRTQTNRESMQREKEHASIQPNKELIQTPAIQKENKNPLPKDTNQKVSQVDEQASLQNIALKPILQEDTQPSEILLPNPRLEEKRKKLKQVISQSSALQSVPSHSTSHDEIIKQKRKEFKKIFAEKLPKKNQTTTFEIDPSKRKSLKNFFMRQPLQDSKKNEGLAS